MRWIVLPMAMPDHPQDERRQAEGFGARDQVESLAKTVDDGLLNTRNEVAQRHGIEDGKTTRQSQFQPALESSRGKLGVDQPPKLAAVDDRSMV